jgi:hypothetical protein
MAMCDPLIVERIAFKSWRDLTKDVRALAEDGWLFRGQKRASWGLKTTLERSVADLSHAYEQEEWMVCEFRAVAHNYISNLPDSQSEDSYLELLAMMQHHGAPTRLLDWTRSPYVAAYFAIEDAGLEGDCAVWAIDTRWCHERGVERKTKPQSLPCHAVRPFTPQRLTERQHAQQAAFILPEDCRATFRDNLLAMGADFGDHLKCFLMPAGQRPTILGDLRLMNISRASLFPGLDGFTQSLKYLLVKEEPYERQARRIEETLE